MKRDHEQADEGPPSANSGESLFDWPRRTGELDRVLHAIHERELCQAVRRSRRRWTVGTLAIVLGASWLTFYRADLFPGIKPSAPTRMAELDSPKLQILPDGSVVELRDEAQIAVAYNTSERRVVLRRGEAHFEVRKDAGRVFVVDAGGVEFRAVGTAFAVQVTAQHVAMIVTEGRVAVDRGELHRNPESEQTPTATIVDAGSRAEIRLDGHAAGLPQIQTLAPQQLSERLAWRVPRLELSETRLAEVVAAFNRHGHVRLRIGDDALSEVAISGSLRADNASTLLRVLESNYGIRAERDAAGAIVLRAGQRN